MMYRKVEDLNDVQWEALSFSPDANYLLLKTCDFIYTLWRDTGEFIGVVGSYRWAALSTASILWFIPTPLLNKFDWRSLRKGIPLLQKVAPNAHATVDMTNKRNVHFVEHLNMKCFNEDLGVYKWK